MEGGGIGSVVCGGGRIGRMVSIGMEAEDQTEVQVWGGAGVAWTGPCLVVRREVRCCLLPEEGG